MNPDSLHNNLQGNSVITQNIVTTVYTMHADTGNSKTLFGLYPRYEDQCKGKGIIVPFHAMKAFTRKTGIAEPILNFGTTDMKFR
jgi:hypothetical protein